MRIVTAISVLLLAALAAVSASAQERAPPDDLTNLKSLLLQLKVNPYPPPRERSAQLLVALIRRMDVTAIDRATVDEIAGLLEDNSDAVRGRVAVALGNIGESAKHTVPTLENAFVRAKEYAGSQAGTRQTAAGRNWAATSADSICFALAKLDATIPPGCVDGRYEPAQPADGTPN